MQKPPTTFNDPLSLFLILIIIMPNSVVAHTPWSKVTKIDGMGYRKETTRELMIEADIISYCRNRIGLNTVPVIISRDSQSFTTKTHGSSLRLIFNDSPDIALLIDAINTYRDFMVNTVLHVDQLNKMGVPDWRRMGNVYAELIDNHDFLRAEGICEADIERLQDGKQEIKRLFGELIDSSIPDCLNHSYFHDGNLLLHDGKMVIIDLGETAIHHPFFSLASFIKRLSIRYQLSEADRRALQESCFSDWTDRDNSRIASVVDGLLPIYGVLTHKRLMDATTEVGGLGSIERMNGRIALYLRQLLAVNNGMT